MTTKVVDCLTRMVEKFCLKWNDFQDNTIKTFSRLRKEIDFFDVTLVADDQKQMMAHKVILSSCSEYLKNILKTNKHSHPLICLTGITSLDLESILDYAYHGEVQIYQEDIDKFLEIAQRLMLNGLLSDTTVDDQHTKTNSISEKKLIAKQETNYTLNVDTSTSNVVHASYLDKNISHATIAVNDSSLDEIEQKILEYLGKNEKGEYVCNFCGKDGVKHIRNMKNHIETHMKGLSFSCSICEKQFRSRNSLNYHKSFYHKYK